ncbi:hypothetical protein FQN50_007870 [Emmonsiellopsis sp. PD_5]|nr:hypothetical protein FQN50_007870 [Emmonsiellopsis sp. PD_5]
MPETDASGNPLITNTRALQYGESHFDRQTFEDRFKATESRLKATESSVADLQNNRKSAERHISDLEGSVADLKDIRNRFISTYKRDILGNNTEADKVIIRTGNRFLYGLHPGIVRTSILYHPTIELLDRHAAAVADKMVELPTKFNDLFANFIQALEASNFDEDYLPDPRSSVTVAYWAFLQYCP